ncbi:DinB family protein [Paenibacillus agricola]|uniref:DinB family protein n=1 Tax=Paenibacillus agricola TaxID=2716264 RepID=A0ABX0JJN7_9BACL|nr:DinB family protein [Paenibacillus agricola]NHN34136.1 DinB family protein [Paenibacillus agricola]
MGIELLEFVRISIFRMCEHYLPKLKLALESVDKEVLWKHEKETLNSIGGIVLHVGSHIQRHVIRYLNSGKIEGGIENHFPDEVATSPSDLIQFITQRFNSWKEVMIDYTDGNKDEKNLDMFDIYHLVEHTGYHLGQIIDRVQRLTYSNFQFVQNGINEKSLKDLIYKDCIRGSWNKPLGE